MLVTGSSSQHCGGKCSFCVFFCLFLIHMKASFVLVTQKATGNPGMIRRCTALISFSTSAPHLCTRSRTQTNIHTIPLPFTLTLKHTVNKDPLSPLCLTCKHQRKDPVLPCDEHLLSDIILILLEISFLNATPLTIELLSVPAIGHLYGDSCQVTAVKTSFLWCQSVVTPELQ